MPIHIGKLIKEKADEQNLSQDALGSRINKTKQNVGDIYKRSSIDTELLLAISKALKFDFFEVYYSEEPLKSMREAEMAKYRKEIEDLKKDLAHKDERIKDLESVAESNKKLIGFLEEERKKLMK